MLTTRNSFRIETVGPDLASRGGLYGVGQAHCSDGGAGRAIEKRYLTFEVDTVDSGVFRYGAEGGQMLAVPGAILFGNAGEAFTCQHLGSQGNRRSVIAIGNAFMADVADGLGLDDIAFKVTSVPPGPQSAALYGWVRRLTQSERVLEDSLIELIAAALGIGRRPREWKRCGREVTRVLEVVKHLKASYPETHRLDELAALARLSRFHFIRVFREVTGVSPIQFLIGLRLRAASERLQTTTQPITSVALETGFGDISHFNRTFRRAFGMSPRRWRACG